MKDILNNKKMLYVGIAVLVIGIAFAIGTYAYYSNTITGTASGQVLAYTCTGNNSTSFTLDPFTNAYPGYEATRTIALNASLYTNATINVSSYTNMGAGSVHPNLLIYNDSEHQNAMSNGVNTIEASITPGTTTNVPIYIYWPYGTTAETYDSSVPSATITIICNQGVSPDDLIASKLASGKTCVAVTNASDLHTETCTPPPDPSFKYACVGDGYSNGATITYGSIWNGTGSIPTGAAFDCDVNGNGVIDKSNGVSTERFYYVSDYFNTQNKTFDTDTGVLIYYKNYKNGAPSDSGAEYATQADIQAAGYEVTSYDNWHGPLTAVNHLPVVSGANAWRSDLLKVTDTINNTKNRAILAENGSTHNATSTGGGTLPTSFEYKNSSNVANAARLITAQEIMRGCNLSQVGSGNVGELSGCKFLFEGTFYGDYMKATSNLWLETPCASDSYNAWSASVSGRATSIATLGQWNVVRPTIDVPKSKLG